MKAYKVFNSDWTCRGFQYKVGETYRLEKNGKLIEPALCERGFHACQKIADCFSYYNFNPTNKVAEVELSGTVLGEDDDKQCANIIGVVKEISWNDMLVMANTGRGNSGNRNSGNRNSGNRNSGNSNSGNRNSGNRNSGNRNSGNSNSGNRNSGNRNSGNSNSGDRNSGSSNSGDRNSGSFNSITPSEILVFNKPCKISDWDNAEKPDLMYIELTKWITFEAMSDKEKEGNPKAFVCDGYLKTFSYKEAWRNSYDNASESDRTVLKNLPNFDAKVFEEITGIDVNGHN